MLREPHEYWFLAWLLFACALSFVIVVRFIRRFLAFSSVRLVEFFTLTALARLDAFVHLLAATSAQRKRGDEIKVSGGQFH